MISFRYLLLMFIGLAFASIADLATSEQAIAACTGPSVVECGAVGNGTTDDTAAFELHHLQHGLLGQRGEKIRRGGSQSGVRA